MYVPAPTSSTRVRFIAGLLIVVPLLVWLWALLRYAVDIAFNDDYALVIFIARWHDPAQSWAARLTDLLALHNTHRIIYDRLVCLVTYYLTGQVNINVLIGLGNLALAGIGWQLWRSFRQLGLPAWYFAPIPFWLFSLQSHENMFWGMAALQNFTVVWFVLEALHQLHRRAPLIWPLLLSLAATLTSGNGMLAFLVGTLLLLSQQRRDRSLWIWLGSTLLVLGVMLGLAPAGEHRNPFLNWLPNLCLAVGGAFTNQTATGLPTAVGALLITVMEGALGCWLTNAGKLGRRLRQMAVLPEWLAWGLFILTTALLLAMHRLPDDLLRDRYKLYAHLMLSLVYLLVLAVASRRLQMGWAVGITLLAAVMNAGAFHACLPRIVAGFQQRQCDAFNFQQNKTTLAIPSLSQYIDSLFVSVHQQGLYRFPVTIKPPATWSSTPSTDSLRLSSFQDYVVQNDFLGKNPCYMELDNQQITHHLADGTDKGIYLAVEAADRHTYLFPASPNKGSIRDFLRGRGPFKPGFTVSFLATRLKPGNYKVNILRIADGQHQLLGAGQLLEISSF